AGRSQPDQGHAIGRDQPGFIMNPAEARVGLRLHHAMHAGDAHIAAAQDAPRIEHEIPRLGETERGHADAEHVETRRRSHAVRAPAFTANKTCEAPKQRRPGHASSMAATRRSAGLAAATHRGWWPEIFSKVCQTQ